jgi:hypothetical protein
LPTKQRGVGAKNIYINSVSGLIENIFMSCLDIRSQNQQEVAVTATTTGGILRDVSVNNCRIANFARAVFFTGVQVATISNNRLYDIGGINGSSVDWAIAMSNCISFSINNNSGNNDAGFGLTQFIEITGASDLFTVMGNAYAALVSPATPVADGSSGANKFVNYNVVTT